MKPNAVPDVHAEFAAAWRDLLDQVRGSRSGKAGSVPIEEIRPDWNWTCDGCSESISYVEQYWILVHAIGVRCLHVQCGESPVAVAAAYSSAGVRDGR